MGFAVFGKPPGGSGILGEARRCRGLEASNSAPDSGDQWRPQVEMVTEMSPDKQTLELVIHGLYIV